MKKIKDKIRRILNRKGYEIIKQEFRGDLYPNISKNQEYYICDTPIGKYTLPIDVEKDPVASTIARGKIFEPEVIEVAKEYLSRGDYVLDIGANFGQMSIEFSKIVGPEGKVFSFEAQKSVFDCLAINVENNKIGDIELFYNAVYDSDDVSFYFEEVDYSKGNPYSSNQITNKEKKGSLVKSIKIDSLVFKKPIRFIKIDIQGSDLFALRGAINTIKKHKPVIIFEFEEQFQEIFNTSFNDYVEFVQEIGYKFVKTVMNINYIIVPDE